MGYDFKKWCYANKLRYDMEFSNKKFKPTWFIYSTGKGKNTDITISFRGYGNDYLMEDLSINDAKQFADFLQAAIIDAEKRSQLPDDE